MTLKDKIIEGLEQLSTDELLSLYREINSYDGSLDQFDIFEMDEFDEVLDGYKPSEIVNSIRYGDFDSTDEYFRFNGYGNLESLSHFDIEEELDSYLGEIADCVEDGNYYNLLPDSIKQTIDEDELNEAEFDEEGVIMKFYGVKDECGNSMAIIWARNVNEAVTVFRRDVIDTKSTITMESELDVLYSLMLKINERHMTTQLSIDEVMRRLQEIISSTVPIVVITYRNHQWC